jgi:trk system potassium uptake protein TrkA
VKVAIAGAGSVGTAIAGDLHANGHEVLLFERDPDLVERLRPSLDITWIAADACEVSSLDAAGLATVDVVVAATGDDEDNLVISLLAKQEFAVPRVVARVNHPKNQWLFNQSWGVDVSVSTPQLLTALVEEAVSVGSLVRLLQFQGGAAHLLEITLAEDSPPTTSPSPIWTSPVTASWWPWCAPTGSSCPAATPCCSLVTRCSCCPRQTPKTPCTGSSSTPSP